MKKESLTEKVIFFLNVNFVWIVFLTLGAIGLISWFAIFMIALTTVGVFTINIVLKFL